MKLFQSIVSLFFTKSEPYTPVVGDRVSVYGDPNFHNKEGVVSSVHDTYCWMDQYLNDKWVHSFTASFSYCEFKKLS